MRKGLPVRGNLFPTLKQWPPKQVYLSRCQRFLGMYRRRVWHGACSR